jgi:uncharacterized YccA/Bax inhibitor family protein
MAKDRQIPLFIILIIVGGLIGSMLGEVIARLLPSVSRALALNHSLKIGLIQPVHVNLEILSITFGFIIKFNVLSILGVITGIIFYYRDN